MLAFKCLPALRREVEIPLRVIGVVESPFETPLDAPRQGFISDKESVLLLDEKYVPALEGIEVGQDVLVLFWAHLANRDYVQSPGGRGAFAGRSLHRPNPIGVSVAKIRAIEGARVRVVGLDAVDGSPLIDLKPAHPEWEGNQPFLGLGVFAEEADRKHARTK